MAKNVLLFFANGTEEVEALVPCDLLRRSGANVTVCGVGSESKVLVGSHKIKVECDILEKDLDRDMSYDMIIVPGGLKGAENLSKSENVEYFLAKAQFENKMIASICASPSVVLGKMNILLGRRAVCYPGFEDGMKGCEVGEEKVVRDDNIITAKGAGVSIEFSLECVRSLYGDKAADELAQKIIWKQ